MGTSDSGSGVSLGEIISYAAMAAVVVAATIVVALVPSGLDQRFKEATISALVVVFAIEALIRARVFQWTGSRRRNRIRRRWVRSHELYVEQVRSLALEASFQLGASSTKAATFPALADLVVGFVKNGGADPGKKLETLYSSWRETRAGWYGASNEISNLLNGPAIKYTDSFLSAFRLLQSQVGAWLDFVSRFVKEARAAGVVFPDGFLDAWATFEKEGNALRGSILGLNLILIRELPGELVDWSAPVILPLKAG